MPEKLTDIISPDKFTPVPIKGLIGKISQPGYVPTDGEIASLVIQYMFAYCSEEKGDNRFRPGALDDISCLFQLLEFGLAHTRFPGATFDMHKHGPLIERIWNICRLHTYAIGMLGDVSATIELFKYIIHYKLDSPGSDFVGLDIGTGSGILALAQYIFARRNKCQRIQIFTLDNNPYSTKHIHVLLSQLIKGNVFQILRADATHPNSYGRIPKKPGFVSCEMIPMSGTTIELGPLPSYPRDTINPDPIIQSLLAFTEYFGVDVLNTTSFFPHGISIQMFDGHDASASFGSDKGIISFCRGMQEKVKSSIRSIVPCPGLNVVETGSIGSEHLQTPDNENGWVRLHPLWRYRWKNFYKSHGMHGFLESQWNLGRAIRPDVAQNLVMPTLDPRTILVRPAKKN